MAFDDSLAARISNALARRKKRRREETVRLQRLPADRQLAPRHSQGLFLARLDPDEGEEALLEPHVRGVLAESGGERVGREASGRVLYTGAEYGPGQNNDDEVR